jgi:hypothetical protein
MRHPPTRFLDDHRFKPVVGRVFQLESGIRSKRPLSKLNILDFRMDNLIANY